MVSSSILPVNSFNPSAIYKLYRSFFPRVSRPANRTNALEIKFLDTLESIITMVL